MMTSMSIDAPTRPARGTPRFAASVGGVVVAGLLGSLPSGCAPEEAPLPPVVWEGESVRVRMDDPDIEVCGGTFEGLDRHAALVREALRLEGDEVVEYSIGDEDFVRPICTSPATDTPVGCAFPDSGRIYTSVPYVPHEIVHSVRHLDPRLGHLSAPFEEGLATLLGADWPDDPVIPLEAQAIFDERYVTGLREYDRAGQMMSILFERHGVEAFREFDETARTVGEDTAFADVFGETKEEFAAAAETMPICEQSQWWVPLVECDGEPITANPATGLLTLSGNVSCGEPDVKGPEYGRMWASRRFRLDSHASWPVSYDFEFPDDSTIEVVECNRGCPERFAYIGTRLEIGGYGGNALGDLEPGDYFLRVIRPVSSDTDGAFKFVVDQS